MRSENSTDEIEVINEAYSHELKMKNINNYFCRYKRKIQTRFDIPNTCIHDKNNGREEVEEDPAETPRLSFNVVDYEQKRDTKEKRKNAPLWLSESRTNLTRTKTRGLIDKNEHDNCGSRNESQTGSEYGCHGTGSEAQSRRGRKSFCRALT